MRPFNRGGSEYIVYVHDDVRRLGLCHFRIQLLMQDVEYHDSSLKKIIILSYHAPSSRYDFGALWWLLKARNALKCGDSARDGAGCRQSTIVKSSSFTAAARRALHSFTRTSSALPPAYASEQTFTPSAMT